MLINIPVYNTIFTDATPPFIVRIYTDAQAEEVTDPIFLNRGKNYKYILYYLFWIKGIFSLYV